MLSSFFKRLNEPFPARNEFRQNLRYTAYVGAFIALFLYVFHAHGMQSMPGGRLAGALTFGLVTTIVSMLFDAFIEHVAKIRTDLPSWVLWKWLVTTILMVCCIAIANFLLVITLVPKVPVSLNEFLSVLQITLLIGSIPIVVSGLLIQLRAAYNHQKEAQGIATPTAELDVSLVPIEFEVSADETLQIDAGSIRFVEAMQNYLAIYYVQDTEAQKIELKKSVIRATLANTEKSLSSTSVMRCHRSYLVNHASIEAISGNAQGLQLSLKNVSDRTIPVSRSFIPKIKAQLNYHA